ncbi:MAG: PAS domain S-box protein [Candidatus Thermoplasmatota archaeon]|nr:PAS domain S-box protein [Candidatus Thermoplasmatota archaeon]
MVQQEEIAKKREKDVLDSLPIGIMILGEGGKIRSINQKLLNDLEIEEEELQDSFIYDMVKPSQIPLVLSRIKKSGKDNKTLNIDIGQGTAGSLSGLLSFDPGEDGRGEGFFVSLDESETTTKDQGLSYDVLEDLPLPVDIVRKDLKLHFQNSASEEMISLVAKGKDPLVKTAKERRGMLMDCFSMSKAQRASIPIKTKEGKIDFEVVAVPFTTMEGEDLALEIWLRSPKENMEGRGELLKGVGDELIESANAIIIGLDLEGNITLFNKGARRALGYQWEEVKGHPWFDLLLDHDAEKGKLEVLQWNIGSGFRTQYESRVRARSGMTLTISLENTVIFDNEENVSMILMIGQDMTKTKNLEESLKEQTEKLIDAIEESELYTDLMIHDMHNANAGIMGYLELLDLKEVSDRKKKSYIERALGEVRKSSTIIRDVKLMVKARPRMELGPVSLQVEINQAVEKIKEIRADNEPDIEMDMPDLHIIADDLLREAVFRVIENSIEHSKRKANTRIKIKTNRDPSRSNIIPDPVHLVIQDNGGGMNKKELENVFHRPTRTDLGSNGLGFYLIKRIIDRYGGIIWLENSEEKEKGLSVHILLREAV